MAALFFDIDGTILSDITHEIPESALRHYGKRRRMVIRHLLIPGVLYAVYHR